MKRLFLGIVTVLGVMVLSGAAPTEPAEIFEITLERSGNDWKAECASGCTWTELAVACPTDCQVLIDANGVTVNPDRPFTVRTFGFVVSGSGRNWQAESVTGTLWTKLGWGCSPFSCRARLTEAGVG